MRAAYLIDVPSRTIGAGGGKPPAEIATVRFSTELFFKNFRSVLLDY